MNFGLFGRKHQPILSYRSKDLSLFMLFNIGRTDAAALIAALEKVDDKLEHVIDINKFARTFCGNYFETFLVLWDLYYSRIDPHPPKTEVKKIVKRETRDSDEEEDLRSLGFLEMPALQQHSSSEAPQQQQPHVPQQQQQQNLRIGEAALKDNRQMSFFSESLETSTIATAQSIAKIAADVAETAQEVEVRSTDGSEDTEVVDVVDASAAAADNDVVDDDDTSDEDAPVSNKSKQQQQQQQNKDAASALTDTAKLHTSSSIQSILGNAPGISEAQHAVRDHRGVPYNYLIFFLFMLMQLPNEELPLWLFWLQFAIRNELPTAQSMLSMIDSVWGTQTPVTALPLPSHSSLPTIQKTVYKDTAVRTDIAVNKGAAVHKGTVDKALAKKKRAAEQMVQSVAGVNELVPNKFRYFDVATGGAWTRPLRLLRKELRSNILGPAFWRRVQRSAQATFADLDARYDLLREPTAAREATTKAATITATTRTVAAVAGVRLSKWGRADFQLIGERKAARKDVRKFIRLFRNYNSMPLEEQHAAYGRVREEQEFDAKYDSRKKNGPFSFLFGGGAKKKSSSGKEAAGSATAEVELSGDSASKRKNRRTIREMQQSLGMQTEVAASDYCLPPLQNLLRGATKEQTNVLLSPQQQQEQLVPLDVLYKESLEVPLQVIYSRTNDSRTRAMELLKQCDDEIYYSEFRERQLAEVRNAQEWLARQAARRQVVVDVSSSDESSGSNSREGRSEEDSDEDHNDNSSSSSSSSSNDSAVKGTAAASAGKHNHSSSGGGWSSRIFAHRSDR